MKVTRKLVIFMLGIALPPVLALISFTYIELQRTTYDTVDTRLAEIADRQKDTLNQLFYDLREKSSNVATRSELRLALDNNAPSSQINDLLRRYKSELASVSKISLIHADGTVIYSTDERLVATKVYDSFSLADFINGVFYYVTAQNTPTLWFISPLSSSSTILDQYILVEVNFSSVVSVLRDYESLGETGETVLGRPFIDGKIQYIGQSRNQESANSIIASNSNLPMAHALAKEENSYNTDIDYRGKEVISATRYIEAFRWGLVVKVDKAEEFKKINTLLVSYTIITVIAVIIIFLASNYFSRRLMAPVIKLSAVTKQIESKENWNQEIDIMSNDEFGDLAQNFRDMTHRMADIYGKLDEKVKLRTAALNDSILELEKFRLAVEHASDHIIITDKEGIILYANPAVEQITGFAPETVVGQKAGSKENWGGQMPAEFYKHMWNVLAVQKKPFRGELTNKRKNGEVYTVIASISPIKDSHGEVMFYAGIERDITKEKEVDLAKTEFVSIASHQLRTPLSSISWYTEMLVDGDAGALSNLQLEYIHEIEKGSKRMTDLVNALLNVSRLELGTFTIEPTLQSIDEICDEAIKELRSQIKAKKLHIIVEKKDVPKLMVDRKLMYIIFQNLLSNAVKYTMEKGDVIVRMFKRHDDFILEIKDSGIGIPKEQQEKIFTKLFRASNATEKVTEGTGLGLYIVKSILDHSGGSVEFESRENHGTTFTVSIPLTGMKEKKGTRQLS